MGKVHRQGNDMKRILSAAVLASSLLFVGGNAKAEMKSIQDYVRGCNPGMAEEQFCIGALEGVASVASSFGQAKEKSFRTSYGFCAPDGTTRAQLKQAFLNWANARPEHWQLPGGSGIWLALKSTWPCE
jgi:hypothetical protein